MISYQPPVVPAGDKPPGEVNGENPSVPGGTGISPAVGVPQAPENTGWNMPPSDPSAQSQPNMPSQGPSLYPDLCK